MRIGTDDKVWVVTDPRPASELDDILSEASIRELELRFRGGLTCDEHPTLFTDREEAEAEAHGRLVATHAAQAIGEGAVGEVLDDAAQIQVLDADGNVLLQAPLGRVR